MSCSCGGQPGGAAKPPRSYSFSQIDAARQHVRGAAPAEFTHERVWALDNQLITATGTEQGDKGCATIPVLGVPVGICWEFEKLDIHPPGVDVVFKISVSAVGQTWWSALFSISCTNVSSPQDCTVSISDQRATIESFSPSCDWGCMRGCAPACISCGTDYWCWAACAVGCVARCCHL
jgi:hypothetical protein